MKIFLVPIILVCSLFTKHAKGYDVIVAKDGSGNYTTVQDAINAAPAGRTIGYTIFIKNGRYKEKITIAATKTFIQLIGESVANTILTYDDYASKSTSCSATLGTQNSASFSVNANDFAAIDITFENSYGDGSQAVTVLVNADRAMFKNCRFLGNQDTVYLKGTGTPKSYFKNCYIDGNIDFIFGSAVALFDSCVLYAKTRVATSSSYITAPNTPTGQAFGFVFKNAILPNNTGATAYFFSRPWPSPSEAATAQKAVFINAVLSSHINAAGWAVWNTSTITSNIYYAEFLSKYFNGNVVDISGRVPWSYQLLAADTAAYSTAAMFGTWQPCNALANFCNNTPASIAISNFTAIKNAASVGLSWNISWPINGIQYQLFRSTNNTTYTNVYTQTASTDTAVNFNYTDFSVPATGSKYYYYVVAAKPGFASHITDTIVVSNSAAIQINAPAALNFCGFNQVLGTPSPSQTYTIAATNLTSNLTITPSADFEVSINGSTWFSNAMPLVITPVAGTVTLTTIYVRLNAGAVDIYTGNIANATDGVNTLLVPVKGRTTPPSNDIVLQAWALTTNTNDSVAVRSTAVIPSTSTLINLFTTDGTLPAPAVTVPPYSNQYGQVFGANIAGNNWQNIGSTLKRPYYQQFTVTAAAGNTIQLDSVTFNCNFYSTASGTKMALVYSKNGFSAPADSTEFSDGIGTSGAVLPVVTSGNFNKAIAIAQNNAGPADYFSLALNGSSGIVLNAGETATIRLYWACGSTGTPRFAMLKNVQVKGLVTTPVPVSLVAFTAVYNGNKVKLNWLTQQEINLQGYEVEKSVGGIQFSSISFVAAKSSIGQNSYSLYDEEGLQTSGIIFYRLKMKNKDGGFSFSNIITVSIKKTDVLKIIPNIVVNNIYVFHALAKQGAAIEIYAIDGRRVFRKVVAKDAIQTTISSANITAGNYNLVFVNNNKIEFVKFIKQ